MDVLIADGISEDEVKRRLRTFGPNTIVSRRRASALFLLLHQFRSPVVYLLGAAAGLAVYFGELEEGAAMGIVLVINALIGFVTELRAARSINRGGRQGGQRMNDGCFGLRANRATPSNYQNDDKTEGLCPPALPRGGGSSMHSNYYAQSDSPLTRPRRSDHTSRSVESTNTN